MWRLFRYVMPKVMPRPAAAAAAAAASRRVHERQNLRIAHRLESRIKQVLLIILLLLKTLRVKLSKNNRIFCVKYCGYTKRRRSSPSGALALLVSRLSSPKILESNPSSFSFFLAQAPVVAFQHNFFFPQVHFFFTTNKTFSSP